jgi:hypothetical protein
MRDNLEAIDQFESFDEYITSETALFYFLDLIVYLKKIIKSKRDMF